MPRCRLRPERGPITNFRFAWFERSGNPVRSDADNCRDIDAAHAAQSTQREKGGAIGEHAHSNTIDFTLGSDRKIKLELLWGDDGLVFIFHII
jgi:hypothetical protein